MKTREGFVSNSSTSSFVLKKADVTEEQLEAIRKHDQSQAFKDCRWSSAGDAWTILEDDECLMGYTWMDNFDMAEYMKELGIDSSVVEMDDTLPAVAWIRDTDFGETFKEMLEAEGESDEDA